MKFDVPYLSYALCLARANQDNHLVWFEICEKNGLTPGAYLQRWCNGTEHFSFYNTQRANLSVVGPSYSDEDINNTSVSKRNICILPLNLRKVNFHYHYQITNKCGLLHCVLLCQFVWKLLSDSFWCTCCGCCIDCLCDGALGLKLRPPWNDSHIARGPFVRILNTVYQISVSFPVLEQAVSRLMRLALKT